MKEIPEVKVVESVEEIMLENQIHELEATSPSPAEIIDVVRTVEGNIKVRLKLRIVIDVFLNILAEFKQNGAPKLWAKAQPKGTGDVEAELVASPGMLPFLKDFLRRLGVNIDQLME